MKVHSFSKLVILFVAVAAVAGLSGFKKASTMTGDEIIEQVKARHAAESELEQIKMVTMDSSGRTQERQIISVVQKSPTGNMSYLIRFVAPEEVKGTTLLAVERENGEVEQYLFLPGLGQPRKIVGTARGGYFMGTDFTFEDLRKEKPTEWVYHRLIDEVVEGRDCYVILTAPIDISREKITGYLNRILYVDKETLNILKIEFFDSKKQLVKTFQAFDFALVEGEAKTQRPQRLVMANNLKRTTTIMSLLNTKLNAPVNQNLFKLETVQNWAQEHDREIQKAFGNAK